MKVRGMRIGVLVVAVLWAVVPVWSASVPIENASFESPAIDPNDFPVLPYIDGWTEIDMDPLGSTNTGVFANTPEGSPDRMVNADGDQLAFIGSESGNGLEQELAAGYTVGYAYRLTVGIGVSGQFPPSAQAPADAIELALYYRDGTESVDIAREVVEAVGLSSSELRDFSVHVAMVRPDEAWAGKTIGVAIRAAGMAGGFWDLDNVRLVEMLPVSVPIENASFESPAVDPNDSLVMPDVDGWTDFDLDTAGGTDTGVFANTPEGSADHVANADGRQLASLGSQSGNGLEQDLDALYHVGCDYHLTVAVGLSAQAPPSVDVPADMLELVLYYRDDANSVDIASQMVKATGLSSTQLQDVSAYLPAVGPDDAWAGKPIGIALRAAGMAGGFWDLDNVRLAESLPVAIAVENPSFELPVVDVEGFPVLPYMESWTEIDLDLEASANTGVFANTPEGSWDRMLNADGYQLAFLGSQQGNGLEQELAGVYEAGRSYRLTVAVGVSGRYPPSSLEPADTLRLVFYYRDGTEAVEIAYETVEPRGLAAHRLQDFSVYLPAVEPDDPWAGEPIGVALRATGMAGGFWDLDNVRLAASLPIMTAGQ